jgi:hypothetical protein
MIYTKSILYMGREQLLACDGNCKKAWGIQNRPKLNLSDDEDDVAYLSDSELGDAPTHPGTYEGGQGKPHGPESMNKWCCRQCERSSMAVNVSSISLPNLEQRLVNQPWKHEQPKP